MRKLFKTCARITEGYHGLFFWSLVVQTVMVFCEVFVTFLLKVAVDALEGLEVLNSSTAQSAVEAFVVDAITLGQGNEYLIDNMQMILPVSIIGSAAITAVVSFARLFMRSYLASGINATMQMSLFSHLERLPYTYYTSHKPGDMLQTCTRDIDVLRRGMIMDVSNINYAFWMVVFCLSVLFSISWKLTVVTACLIPILFVYSFFLIKKVRSRYRLTDDSEARMTDKINENLGAVRIVKAYGNEAYEINDFERYLDDYQGKFISWRKLSSFFFSSSDIFIFASKALAVCYGVYLAYVGEIHAGTLVLSFSFISMIVWPVRQVSTTFSNLGMYLASADRVAALLDTPMEDVDSGLTPEIKGGIEFKDVYFRYEGAKDPVLKGVSFSVKPGETVAIMGKTGAGKSTMSMLLTRLYDYDSGSIKIDGVELRDIKKKYLRKKVVPVLQDPFLFSKSIEENIRMARSDATEEDIKRAARIASVDKTIEGFKEGYLTQVGEKGMSLSGGQKQRVAIARTLLSDAPVIIFDDSLSAVDTDTDLKIRRNLASEKKGATSIIITHRVSTAKDADLIVVLEDGKVSEMGTHEELASRPGLYARINAIQSKMA